MLRTLLFVIVCCVMVSMASAEGDFYTYTDTNGTQCFTTEFSDIPPQYRSQVKVTGAAQRQWGKNATSGQQAPQGAEPQTTLPVSMERARSGEPSGRFALQFPWLKLIAGALLVVGLLIGVHRLANALLPRQLAIAVSLALFLAVGVYVYKLYVDHVAAAYFQIKQMATSAQKAVDKRGSKIEKAGEPQGHAVRE